jgi:hypothetical protein
MRFETVGRAEWQVADPFFVTVHKKGKKRSSQASWKTCCLGTPFPRSALFLHPI